MTDQQKNEVWRRSIKIPPKVENSNDHVELIVDNQPWTEWVSTLKFDKGFDTALGTSSRRSDWPKIDLKDFKNLLL